MSNTQKNIFSIERLYQAINEDCSAQKSDALLLLAVRSWFTAICDFDTLSGESLSTDLDDFLQKIAQIKKDEKQKDRFYHLVEHCKESILVLIKEMREKVVREHETMPIYAVREVDMNTIIWLSSKPGRNVKQKLSSKPVIKAVRRRYSFDTLENRLLKFICSRFEEILFLRELAFEKHPEDWENFYLQVLRFLRNDAVKEINLWGNERPNNVLLSDKRYKKILNSYNWLRSIDDDINFDFENKYKHLLISVCWNLISTFSQINNAKIPQIPFKNIDYQKFNIELFRDQLEGKIGEKIVKFTFHTFHTEKNDFHIDNNYDFWGRRCADFDADYYSYLSIEYNDQLLEIRYDDLGIYCVDCKTNECFYCFNSDERNFDKFIEVVFRYFNQEIPASQSHNECDKLDDIAISVIDICSTSPTFLYNGKIKNSPFKLLTQFWKDGNKDYNVNCKNSKALYLQDNITTDSMYKICMQKKDTNNIMLSYVEQIKEYLPAETMLYLLPDNASDFETSNIRKCMNFYFAKAEPVPKSIASIFAFQNSHEFANVKDKDEFNIVDICREGYVVTKIQAKYEKEVESKIPETKGIVWERHPCKIVKENWKDKLLEILKKEIEADFAEKLLQIFGKEIVDYSDLSFIDANNDWHNVSENICAEISKFLKESVENFAQTKKNAIIVSNSVLSGAETLHKWQKIAGKLNLWYDHLPELSIKIPINGCYDNFYLVKEIRIAPKFGEKTKIPVKSNFTLPAEKESYTFPLFQGDSGNSIAYDMLLKSNQFPLQKDTTCKLNLTYTYGEENPYELIFTSNETQPVKAEWIAHEKPDLDKMPAPKFPPKKSWEEFRKYPDKYRKDETNDLLEILTDSFNILERYWQEQSRQITNQRYNGYTQIKIDVVKNKTNRRFHALTIWNGHSLSDTNCPLDFRSKINVGINHAKEILQIDRVSKSLKYDLFAMISRMHKDCPDKIANILLEHSEKKLYLQGMECPNFGHGRFDFARNIAYSIGTRELEWQKGLFYNTLKQIFDRKVNYLAFYILSIALWRDNKLAFLLNVYKIEKANLIHKFYSETIINQLNDDIENLKEFNIDIENSKKIQEKSIPRIIWKLEVLLALLRLRETDNIETKQILSTESEFTKEYLRIVDKITKFVIDNKVQIVSYLQFDIKKPEVFEKTPDLLYALRMYLCGDDGANTIHITGLNESNEILDNE